MNIAVYGAGYVGTVSAACLASLGHRVWLVESSESKLATLKQGRSPVLEPGLEEMLSPFLKSGQVIPVKTTAEAVPHTSVSIICVGTPSLHDGRPDVQQVRLVAADIARELSRKNGAHAITVRSTIPYPRVVADVYPVIQEHLGGRFGDDIGFALNPEFLREGCAIKDFLEPSFVVVGSEHTQAIRLLGEVYEPLKAPVRVVSPGAASLLKYACNAFHAAKIVFANEIGSLSEAFDADPRQVMELFCEDRVLNVSPAYLKPGYAYGGSCLPKDIRALNQMAATHAVAVPLLQSLPASNDAMIQRTIDTIESSGGKKVVLVGLSFKVSTDDLRESPFVELSERLLGKGYDLRIYDPDVKVEILIGRNLQFAQRHLQHLAKVLVGSFEQAVSDAELVVVGKRLLAPEVVTSVASRGIPVLDLTRDYRPSNEGAGVHHLSIDTLSLSRKSGV